MTSASPTRILACGLVLGLAWLCCLAFAQSRTDQAPLAGRRYGPTAPSGYYVRVAPSLITMPYSQQRHLSVTVEDAAGRPVDGVLVTFAPSEGTVLTTTSRTRGGEVTGTYTPGGGGDRPRTVFITITVEDLEVTAFINIVPTVFSK
jgi:hypothetical protein